MLVWPCVAPAERQPGQARYLLRTKQDWEGEGRTRTSSGSRWSKQSRARRPDGQTDCTAASVDWSCPACSIKALWEPEEVTRFEFDKYLHSTCSTTVVTCEQTVIPPRFTAASYLWNNKKFRRKEIKNKTKRDLFHLSAVRFNCTWLIFMTFYNLHNTEDWSL